MQVGLQRNSLQNEHYASIKLSKVISITIFKIFALMIFIFVNLSDTMVWTSGPHLLSQLTNLQPLLI